ncbi:MarR family transcriptional regulator [Nevskia sp.]|uniref:MarR family winged helix-turn-helix transcriptional regulator n=1 Tax=Nevskia sp. TaxID=1929292 RepID=UPI0025E5FF39|nr:MarR family transcriptional regulator [Nevskia sp.]
MTAAFRDPACSRTANLLGALALSLNDEMREATEAVTGGGGETSAALVSIGHAPACSIDFLARLLHRSHPGTVRLVDRLAAASLVERRAGADGRTVALHLTVVGEQLRRQVLAARQQVLERVVAAVPAEQQAAFAGVVESLLKTMRGSDFDRSYTICRLCDERTCSDCPMGD